MDYVIMEGANGAKLWLNNKEMAFSFNGEKTAVAWDDNPDSYWNVKGTLKREFSIIAATVQETLIRCTPKSRKEVLGNKIQDLTSIHIRKKNTLIQMTREIQDALFDALIALNLIEPWLISDKQDLQEYQVTDIFASLFVQGDCVRNTPRSYADWLAEQSKKTRASQQPA